MTKFQWIRILFITSITIVILGGYTYMGGFNKTIFEEREDISYTMWVKEYKGSIKKKEFGILFEKAEFIRHQYGQEAVCAVYFKTPNEENDYSSVVWVGIIDNNYSEIEGYTKVQLNNLKTLYAKQDAHPIVSRIYARVDDYIEENNLEIEEDLTIEYYYPNNRMALEVGLK